MKISVIGTGKTGCKVVEMLGENLVYAFDKKNPPTKEKLYESDVVIIFVPGNAVSEILNLVLESGTLAVWGSTGFEWPKNLDKRVHEANSKWVVANNFSLGMNIIRHAIDKISDGSDVLDNPSFKIQEVHHIHKQDAPSGTALSWKQWLGKQVDLSSVREGDVHGIHELRVSTAREEITLKHEALDRSIFAEGAIWAAEQLVKNQQLSTGVHTFGALFDLVMNES